MFYKIDTESELHKELTVIKERIIATHKECMAIVNSVEGSTGAYAAHSGEALAGAIAGIVFKWGETPENWKIVHEYNTVEASLPYARRKAVKEIREKIEAAPMVKYSELNNLINYDPMITADTGSINKAPCIVFVSPFPMYITKAQEIAGYKPVAGMIEIDSSEYRELQQKTNYGKEEK